MNRPTCFKFLGEEIRAYIESLEHDIRVLRDTITAAGERLIAARGSTASVFYEEGRAARKAHDAGVRGNQPEQK